jgi:hypothetical protein
VVPNPTSKPLEVAFEAFLKECNLANRNLYTRVILNHHKIRHWSHFLLSSKENLCSIGLKEGPPCLLCQGAKAHQAAHTVSIDWSNTAAQAVLKQPCLTVDWTGMVQPKPVLDSQTGLPNQFPTGGDRSQP